MSDRGEPDKQKANQARGGRDTARTIADPGADLPGLSAEGWVALSEDDKTKFLLGIDESYKQYLDSLFRSADLCVDKYNELIRTHKRWRRTAIVGSGIMALINFAAAHQKFAPGSVLAHLPIAAAVFALILAVLANLETFSNAAEKAQAFRESRELFLDAAQEFDRVWTVYVIALGHGFEAYTNAVELYKRIIATDCELRSKFKELGKDR